MSVHASKFSCNRLGFQPDVYALEGGKFLDRTRRKLFNSPCDFWGHSSIGRASAWHAEGRRFDPDWLHHFLVVLVVVRAFPQSFSKGTPFWCSDVAVELSGGSGDDQ